MKLLFIVLNQAEKLEDVLEGLIETGVTGATVIDSVGMGHIMEGVPLFAGLRSLFRSAKPENKTIFSLIRETQVEETMEVLNKILGCTAGKASTGFAFIISVEKSIGIC